MKEDKSCTSHTPESSKPKHGHYKIILKFVLLAVLSIWRLYRSISRLIEFVFKLLG